MITLVFCLRRQPHLDREAFQRYWRERHGPLMKRNFARMGCHSYRQLHTLDGGIADRVAQSRGGPEPYDGLAVVTWESLEAMRAATGSDDGRAAGAEMLADERTFIDLERSPIFLTEGRFGVDAGES